MAFVRKVKTASGATAVQIVRKEHRRNVVVEHVGSAHTDAELAALMLAARAKIEAGQAELDLDRGEAPALRRAIVEDQVSRLLIEVITGAWRRLGFDVIDDEAFFQLVLARIVEPTSMREATRVLGELGVVPAHRNTFTATLRRAGQRDYRDQIATACFQHAATHGDV